MKRITADWLISHEACTHQVEIFREEWPDGAEVNLTNALRAVERGLAIQWLAKTLPPSERKAYKEAITPELNAYNEAARNDYDEASRIGLALKVYAEAIAPALVAALRK